MSLAERIYHSMETDDDGPNSDRIITAYEAASEETKMIIDDIFISLTGWTLKTMIEQEQNGTS